MSGFGEALGKRPGGEVHDQIFDAKFGKSFREALNPLISLKTAKLGAFGTQGYQRLSKFHDFAGETNSFRFRFVLPFFRFARNGAPGAKKPQRAKNLEIVEKSFFRLVTL